MMTSGLNFLDFLYILLQNLKIVNSFSAISVRLFNIVDKAFFNLYHVVLFKTNQHSLNTSSVIPFIDQYICTTNSFLNYNLKAFILLIKTLLMKLSWAVIIIKKKSRRTENLVRQIGLVNSSIYPLMRCLSKLKSEFLLMIVGSC